MRYAALALAFLSVPAALWAQDVPSLRNGLDALRQEEPQEEPAEEQAEPGNPPPLMEFLYWNSRIEAGALLTRFDKDLDIETDAGVYARYLLRFTDLWTFTVTYRHYSFENSDLPGVEDEWLLLRELMAGGGVRLPLTAELGLEAFASAGAMWWESQHADRKDDASFVLSGEVALTVRLHRMMSLKIGGVVDFARTDFHRDSMENVTGLSGFLAFEIGN